MDNSRYDTFVTVGGRQFPMRYTTAASIKIRKLLEGRDIQTLQPSEQIETVLDAASTMINCAVAARNMEYGTDEKGLRNDEIALLASEEELVEIVNAMKELRSGKNRDIKTEEPEEKKENAE